MAKTKPVSDFKQQFMHRVAAARERADLTQDELAKLLGIDQDKYKNYEIRDFLPHPLVERFCIACRIDPIELFYDQPASRPPGQRRRKKPAVAAAA